MRSVKFFALLLGCAIIPMAAQAQTAHHQTGEHWVTSWTGSAQGPYPSGYPSAQPNLRFAIPSSPSGAHDQTFRLILHPDFWGSQARLRFSNTFGTKPVTFDDVYAGLRLIAGTIVSGTNEHVLFQGKPSVTIQPGKSVWSDPVPLFFVRKTSAADLAGRKLVVSFHIPGDSGPMTWHAKALTTSYISPPGSGSVGKSNADSAFPYTTASWYFLDAVDMRAPADTHAIVAFGDSITDGTDSTLNGDDRWPDVLQRRLNNAYGSRLVVVNEGIGGNQVIGPARYTPSHPFVGGPAAEQRLNRDAISLSGVSTVIFMEGINDIGKTANAKPKAVEAGIKRIVTRLRKNIPGVRIIGVTLTPDLHSINPDHGSAIEDAKRKEINTFIRTSHLFNGVFDFSRVVGDKNTGGLRPQFIPDSTIGGPGDGLHPDHAGYQAMGDSIDLKMLKPAGSSASKGLSGNS